MQDRSRLEGSSPRAEWTRVIVLAHGTPEPAAHPDHFASPEESSGLNAGLQREFEKRDWFAIIQTDPYAAFAELALRERAQATRAAWGLQRMEGLALLVVEPERWPAHTLTELLAAVQRLLPHASLWTARSDRIEPIPASGAVSTPLGRDSRARTAVEEHSLASQRRLEAASVPVAADPPAFSIDGMDGAATRTAERLSREEIDMLLHDGEMSEGPAPGKEAAS